MANEQNLTPFKKGQVANPNGRPRKWVSQLKEKGYKKSEIVDAINVLISMDEDELTDVATSKDVSVLEKVVALSILESIRKKTLYNIETLLTRVYGQPKQEIEAQVNITAFKVKFNDGNNIPEGGL